MTTCSNFINIFVIFSLINFVDASFCGESLLPYHIKISSNNDIILGCAKPTCLNFPPGALPHFSSFENGDLDGFKIPPKSSERSFNITEKIECDSQFGSTKCVNDDEWIGGIHPKNENNFEQLSFRCCRNSVMKKAKFHDSFELQANEEFKNGGDIYERGKLLGFDYINNIVKYENDGQGIIYEIFINRISCNDKSLYNDTTTTTTTTTPTTTVASSFNFKGYNNKNNERKKLYQALLAETNNANNINDLQNINEPENGVSGAGAGGAGAGGCATCTNIQVLTNTGRGINVPVTQTSGTDANGCRTITVSCESTNPATQISANWQEQGAARGISSAPGIVTETLTCNNAGQLILTEPTFSGVVNQVECTTPADVPPPPLQNFPAPPQILQQPFQPVQFIPQQQPFGFQAGAAPAPVQYPVAGYGGVSNPSLNYLCFSADTFVTTVGKEKMRMDELKIGDWVLSGDSKNGELGFSKVVSWIHRKPNLMAEFMKFTLENGQELKITKNHYIYKGECKNDTTPLSKINNNLQMVYAENVEIDDCVFTLSAQNELIETRILKIQLIQEKGIYAPLTETGNIIVNEILASCYSNLNANPMQQSIPTFTETVKILLSSFGFEYLLTSASESLMSRNEFDLIPGFNFLIYILKDILPHTL